MFLNQIPNIFCDGGNNFWKKICSCDSIVELCDVFLYSVFLHFLSLSDYFVFSLILIVKNIIFPHFLLMCCRHKSVQEQSLSEFSSFEMQNLFFSMQLTNLSCVSGAYELFYKDFQSMNQQEIFSHKNYNLTYGNVLS